MTDRAGVLVVGELTAGRLSAGTRELLARGRELADTLGSDLIVMLLGDDLQTAGEEAVSCGVDEAYLAEGPLLKSYQAGTYLQVLERSLDRIQAEILLMSQTAVGRDLAPRLACRLKTGLSMDCVDLAIEQESGLLLMTRPVYGGKALAVTVCGTKPQMATVRIGAMKAVPPAVSRNGKIITLDARVDPSLVCTRIIDRIEQPPEGVPLEDARVVVCGGRGVESAESFAVLTELAQLLGGAMGASRPPCDLGWVSPTRQIGLTGKVVSPDLYIAVAVSGSSQHMAGCSNSGRIVAINKDPEAGIFSFAHFGLVGDYREILPPFMQRVKEILTS